MALDIQLDIDPKKIEEMIAKAVLDSAIGKTVEEGINKAVADLDRYDGPIRNAIRTQVQQIVYTVIRDEYGEKLREAVRLLMTDEVVNEVANKAFKAFLEKMG